MAAGVQHDIKELGLAAGRGGAGRAAAGVWPGALGCERDEATVTGVLVMMVVVVVDHALNNSKYTVVVKSIRPL